MNPLIELFQLFQKLRMKLQAEGQIHDNSELELILYDDTSGHIASVNNSVYIPWNTLDTGIQEVQRILE